MPGLVSNTILQKEEQGFHGKMVDSRSGTGNKQVEPGASRRVRK